ncbi:response regulator transcription factor [Chitinimonas arctica]|uniref:Response regulator transcription factor n=1 Tax=Chitinimonas arctica TaxID=2594795 RepID=A0A516SBC5_9NEIS|nr:response regulator transcription factor [Chitinimonas arctica]QDQ25445.1 response regulator transcription factor [Chitinimonas arctica]
MFNTAPIAMQIALIVEDHPLYREALTRLLQDCLPGYQIKSTHSAEEGLRLAAEHELPAVLLLDMGLPGLCGVDAIVAFRRKWEGLAIIAVSASEDRREATAALSAGVRAFVSKAVAMDVMTDIVQQVVRGGIGAPKWVTAQGEDIGAGAPLVSLTPRQREIVMMLSKGYSNKEISLRLGLAEITVKVHVSSVFRALNVVNRTQAVLMARRLGLYTMEHAT